MIGLLVASAVRSGNRHRRLHVRRACVGHRVRDVRTGSPGLGRVRERHLAALLELLRDVAAALSSGSAGVRLCRRWVTQAWSELCVVGVTATATALETTAIGAGTSVVAEIVVD